MSVEVSTWFLITRRAVKQIFPGAWNALHVTLTICHYVAWFAIRVFVQNGVFIALFKDWWAEARNRNVFCFQIIGPIIQGILCAMNVKWTRDLIKGIIKNGFLPKHEKKGL